MAEEKIDRPSCLFYESYFAIADMLDSGEESYQFVKKLFDYGTKKIDPCFEKDTVASTAWVLIKPLLDANIRNYKNGCKGGRPKGSKNNPGKTAKKPLVKPDDDQKETTGLSQEKPPVMSGLNPKETPGCVSVKPTHNQWGNPLITSGETHSKGNDNVNVNENEKEININIIKHNNVNNKKNPCAPSLSALGGAEGRSLVDGEYRVKPFEELEEGERWT